MCLMLNECFKNKNFQWLKYNIFVATEDIVLDNSRDPDSNYFITKIKHFNTPYVKPEEFHSQFKNHMSGCLSFLHINMRSINKNFENVKLFLSSLGFTFSVVSLSEWYYIQWDSFPGLSINSDDAESMSVELLLKNRKNTIFNVWYRQTKGQIYPFEKFLKRKFSRIKSSNKQFHVVGDFNLNFFD